jgi:hypothetical protein
MSHRYTIQVLKNEPTRSLPGLWPEGDLYRLLEALEFDDGDSIPSEELLEMVAMALNEQGLQQAGEAVLKVVMGNALSGGQIQNAAKQLATEKLWERHRLVALQKRFFHVAWLMHRAFPSQCKEPACSTFDLAISSTPAGLAQLTEQLDHFHLVKLISACMDDNFIVTRVYGDQFTTKSCPEAAGIIWSLEHDATDTQLTARLIANSYWLADLTRVELLEGDL